MSRNALSFLRPYQFRGGRSLKPEHARAYLSVQRRFTQSLAAGQYTGPHNVEKQKRIDQLEKVKPLRDYHPRMVHPAGADSLSLRDFYAKYEGIQQTKPDVVSVFGMFCHPQQLGIHTNSARKGPIGALTRVKAHVPGH